MIQKSTLDNGIRVITEKIPEAHSVTVGFWVKNGSRHEQGYQKGISHFIEHMLFKGTERRTSLEIAKEIDSAGGILNAFTSREFSCYYAKVLADKAALAVDLLSDIVLHSVFDLDEIEKERRVILQEIYMVEDTPDDQIHDLFSENFWKDHPLGTPVLGTRESVSEISRDNLLAFLNARYCGDNVLICAAGNLDHQQIVDQISEAFCSMASCAQFDSCVVPEVKRQINVLEKEIEQVHICLGTKTLPQDHPDRFAAYLMNAIIGGSMSSRLFQKVREERGLAYSIYSYLNSHSDAAAMILYAGTAPEDVSHVIAIMLKELKRFKSELVSEEELQSAKEQLKGNLLLSLESTDNRMTRLAKSEIYLGRNISLKDVLRGFDRVSPEDMQNLAHLILKDEFLNLQLLGKARKKDFPLMDLTLG